MTPYEQLALGYFALVLAATGFRAHPRAVLLALGAIGLVIVARFLPWPIRVWLPLTYLVLGYWIPAASVSGPHPSFETWLARADGRLPGLPAARRIPEQVLELSYLLCYPMIPAGFVLVQGFGTTADVNVFWVSTLGAGYACYASLPWATARPPRLTGHPDSQMPSRGIASLNAAVLGRLSHRYVTFPSGHAAVSVAVAFATGSVRPLAGLVFGALAVLIAVAAVAGRYHFAVDVLLGMLVGAVVPLLTAGWSG